MTSAGLAQRLASGLGRLLLRFGGVGAGLAARLLAHDQTQTGKGWRKYAEGILAWRRGDHLGALEMLRAAAQALPDEPPIAVSLALAFANVDQWDVAIEAGERALKFFAGAGDEPQLWQMLAWGYLITGRYRSVIELMQRMQEAGVGVSTIELPLMLARAMVWQQEPSIAHLRGLLRRARGQLAAYLRFVEHLAETGQDRLGVLLLAPLQPPAVVRAMDTMAHRAVARGRAELVLWAANALERLEVAPELARAIAALAAAMEGEDEAARRYAAEAAQLGPEHALVQEKLAMVYAAVGDATRALDAATRAVMAGSADALCAGMVAAGLADKGALAEARRIFATQRSGDALGAMVAHVVQARLFAADGREQDVERVLTLAADEAREVPRWARRRGVAQVVEHNLKALGQQGRSPKAREAMTRLAEWVAQIQASDVEEER